MYVICEVSHPCILRLYFRQMPVICSCEQRRIILHILECMTRDQKSPCNEIKRRGECLTTKDSRSDFANQNCVWCLGDACPKPNVCEPQQFLEKRKKRAGEDFETCLGM